MARTLELCSPPLCLFVPAQHHSVAAAPPFPGTWASGISVGSNPLQLLLGARHVPAAGSELTARVLPMGALKSGSKEHQAHKDRDGLGLGVEPRAGLWPWHSFQGKRERWLGTGRWWSFHNNKGKIRGEK